MSHDKEKRLVRLIRYKDYLQSNSLPRVDDQEFWGQKTNPIQKEADKIFRQINRMSADELFAGSYAQSPLAEAIKLGDNITSLQILEKEGITKNHLLEKDGSCPALQDAEKYGNEKTAEKIKTITQNQQLLPDGEFLGTQRVPPAEVGVRLASIGSN